MCYHKFFTPTHSSCEENKFKVGVISVRLKWLYGLTQSWVHLRGILYAVVALRPGSRLAWFDCNFNTGASNCY